MRLKIKYSLSGRKQIVPLNYQYPISAWIYKVLAGTDKEFTNRLHENGYRLANGKSFKLFTFSKLQFPKHTWKIPPKSDRMEVWARNAWLTVSFQLPEQMEKFIMGLFQQQKAFIGDKFSGIEMVVESIEALENVEIGECEDVGIGALTPIVLGIYVKGEKNEQYLPPVHPQYKALFLQNLLDKYRAIGKTDYNLNDLDFKVKKLYTKTAMQRIKAGTPSETKVKAYYFDFYLSAPKEVIEVGLNAGFGSMNALGFGFCEVV